MSQVRSDVDLAALARPTESVDPPRRGWLRIVLPLAIVAAFAFVLRDALVELLRTRPEVTLARPLRMEGTSDHASPDGSRATASIAVQAAGWVEPDPFPTHVPALSGGVVAEVLVQEADAVAAGDPVARLVVDDARLARDRAAAEVARTEGALEVARVRAAIAHERFDAALEVTEAARTTEARRVGKVAESEHREAAVAEGEARVALAESEVVVQRELDAAGAAGARQVEIAEAELEVARAKLAVLRADLALARADAEQATAAAERAARDLELRFDDRLTRDVAAAEVVRAEGELARARAALAEADLRLERTTVVAPSAGVVLERLATAGDVLAPGAAVCSLYDPAHLRVRVDVPQGDVERLFVGQAAEVHAEVRAERPWIGEVIRVVERADIQKVTLEAQVRVEDPGGLLKPDVLTQVRFFDVRADAEAPTDSGAPREAAPTRLRLAIPARLVDGDRVWVFDPAGDVARRRTVRLGRELADGRGLVEVLDGVNLTDKLVDEGRAALAAAGTEAVAVRVRGGEVR